MTIVCVNPYCPSPRGAMRRPTCEEIERLRAELNGESLNRLNRNEITLQVCITCGTWVSETWDEQRNIVVRQLIASPFKFNAEDRAKVTLKGEHYGMVGVITRRTRQAKTIMPPPPPDNVYYLVFKDDSKEYGYTEASLTSVNVND